MRELKKELGLLTIVQPICKQGVKIGNGTCFVFSDGTKLTGVTRCIVTFAVNEIVTAKLDMALDQVENIEAHPMLSIESVKAAAEHYGFELVRKADS
jgi:hypothetical protein